MSASLKEKIVSLPTYIHFGILLLFALLSLFIINPDLVIKMLVVVFLLIISIPIVFMLLDWIFGILPYILGFIIIILLLGLAAYVGLYFFTNIYA